MLSLIFLVCKPFPRNTLGTFLETVLNHSGYIFCPEVETYEMILNLKDLMWLTA